MDLQSVEQLKAPLWRALRLGVVMLLVAASGLLLSSLLSTSHGRFSLDEARAPAIIVSTSD
ncbi:MAG: hypothetical protein F9K44_03500 [Hyphomicrobiaceae bacterium]|nr:MAG: hypothetical protein F9K44_03500 [Hyphomicrobiaceae bacterium]